MKSLKPDELIQLIEKAFDGVPKSVEVTLRVARGYDDYLPESQMSELRAKDIDKRWQEVTDEDLQEYWDVHPFLDPEGFRYYIPAFMIWCIRYYNSSDLATGQWTLSSLWLEPEKLEILNSAQCKAIVEFLKFAIDAFDEFDSKDAKKLYDDFWKQYN